MDRFFNTAGPIKPEYHYCIPPIERFDLDEIEMLIAQGKYFVLHAPRQVGKTSYLLALADYLNNSGRYRCLYINVEGGQSLRENVAAVVDGILGEVVSRAETMLGDSYPRSVLDEARRTSGAGGSLNQLLTLWSKQDSKPIVLFVDEIDSLIGDSLLAVLRQLRAGYDKRPASFPQSIILCGVRDVRDYRIQSTEGKEVVAGGSAFNIRAVSLRMGDFTFDEVQRLYAVHTQETGQIFEDSVLDLVWELTSGQPWLVNALGYEVCFAMKPNRDRTIPITSEMILEAKENLILRRETHLDQLVHKLEEARVRRVIEPILSGEGEPESIPGDDLQYAIDLGLVTTNKQLRIANAIYKEVIPRELTYTTQVTIIHDAEWYVTEDGSLDMSKLLAAFQQFFREHSEHWVERFDYKEAGPQLLLQAFLQRIVNGGGQITREYGLGRRRTDLLLVWPTVNGKQRVAIELKIQYKSLEKTEKEGIEQTDWYMDRVNANEGHLLIFNRNYNLSWEDKIFSRTAETKKHKIQIWGM